jgi:ABC-type bacteriocin/lantibiotic exporter with double-glycine peptidase domain
MGEEQKNYQDIDTQRWKSMLFWLAYMEREDLVRLFIMGVLFSVFSLVTPLGTQALVNTFLFTGLLQPVIVLVGAIFIGLLIATAFRLVQVYMVELLQRRVMVRTTYEISKKITRSDPRFLHAENGLELVNRAFDIEAIQKAISGLLVEGVALVLQMSVGLIILGMYHEVFILFDFIFVVSIFLLIKLAGFGGAKTSILNSKKKHDLVAWLESLVAKRALLNHPDAEALAEAKTNYKIKKYLDTREGFYTIFFRQIISTHVIQVLASVSLLGVGGYLVIANEITVGQLVAAELIISAILYSLMKVQKQMEDFYNLVSGLDKVGELLEIPQIAKRQGFRHIFKRQPSIEMQQVTYRAGNQFYKSMPLSFKLDSGEHLVIVGRHGVGKSRLLEAINAASAPDTGVVKIDGVDVKSLATDTLRKQILFVSGQQFLPGSLIDNLTFGDYSHDAKAITAALEKAKLLEVIEAFGHGLDIEIKPNGFPLSPGQRVQLACARCFLLQPKVILADLGFDVLDKQLRDYLLSVMLGAQEDWTVIATSYQDDVIKKFQVKLNLDDFRLEGERKV